ARSRLHLLEQPYVFDRYRGLVGERGHELDLLAGKRTDFGTHQSQNTDCDTLAQHRHTQDGAKIAQPLSLGERIVGIGPYVRNLNCNTLEQGAATGRASIELDRNSRNIVHEFSGNAEG